MKQTFLKGLRHGLPIGLGYLSVSFAFGIKAVSDGLLPVQAVLISMTNLTSAGQLAGLPLMVGGASLMEMALTQLIINLRYALMSLSLGQKLDKTMTTLHRMCFAFANTDEIFAVASSQPGAVGKHYLYGLMVMPFAGWTLGTLLGALGGQLLPTALTSALGLALYGMFLAIIIPPSKKSKNVLLVVIGAAVSSCMLRFLLPTLSGGMRIIICAVAMAGLGAVFFPVEEKEENA